MAKIQLSFGTKIVSVFAVLMNTQQCWLAVLRLIRTLAVCKAKLVFFSGLEVREKSGGFAFGGLL